MNVSRSIKAALIGFIIMNTGNLHTVSGSVTNVEKFGYSGPIVINQLSIGDTSDIKGDLSPLDFPIGNEDSLFRFTIESGKAVDTSDEASLHIYSFAVQNRHFTPALIKIEGAESYSITVDGEKTPDGKLKLAPGTHQARVKVLAKPGETAMLKVMVETPDDSSLVVREDGHRMFSLDDVMFGTRIQSASISPKGGYISVTYTDTPAMGKPHTYSKIYDVRKGSQLATSDGKAIWMPKTDRYVIERKSYSHGRHLVAIDPASGHETVLTTHMPDGDFIILPTEDYLIFDMVRKGPVEDPDVYRVIEPEDRQPGWRDRHYPAVMALEGGLLRPLVKSNNDVRTVDISPDGKHILAMVTSRHMTERPTTRFSLLSINLATLESDTIVDADGFISEAAYTSDGKGIVVMGSPEAFNRVGCVLPADKIPSMYDYQLYRVDVETKDVTPLTRDFTPSVNLFTVSKNDGRVYFTATERDMYTLYSVDPYKGDIQHIDTQENVVAGVSVASTSPTAVWWGQSDSAPDAVYRMDTRKGYSVLIDRPASEALSNVDLAKCIDWSYRTTKGDTVYARYYLPNDFDPSKKYPLIVNYYGGCTPSTRLFYSRYPMHLYASLGYVVLQITPSGAIGLGQEWSSRHVSTAGKGVAEDIIEGTKAFCQEMPYINTDKIGCIGASYGGFMTQYLLTQTDLFAAAVSHAGISDHTSYWGEGWWGYSYSETAMGNDKPWSATDLYVNQSPLYNADKIKTPILFVHGDADTNVPVGESIQMFTALKLLGVDTELVQVRDQDHHIKDPEKRRKWQNTIFAWFAKHLQDNPLWWNEMYPPTSL